MELREYWLDLAALEQEAGGIGPITTYLCVPPAGSFLDNLHVTPERTGQGIGRLLLNEAARRLVADGTGGALYLWVIEQNSRARQFYARAGATEVETALLPMPDEDRILVYENAGKPCQLPIDLRKNRKKRLVRFFRKPRLPQCGTFGVSAVIEILVGQDSAVR